jgi:hypothetical protein
VGECPPRKGRAMERVLTVGDHEIEAGCVVEQGAFRATVVVRARQVVGPVRQVGYVFAEGFASDRAAIEAARRYALIASLRPDRHLAAADVEFALQ